MAGILFVLDKVVLYHDFEVIKKTKIEDFVSYVGPTIIFNSFWGQIC